MTVPDVESRGRLRPARRADLYAVVRIESRSFESPWELRTFEEFLDSPAFLVLEDPTTEKLGETVAGYVVATAWDHRGTRLGHVKDLAVKPELRDAGRGRRLLEGALSILDTRGTERVRLEVRPSNRPAISLYRSVGFEIASRRSGYYPDGEDAYVLVRDGGPSTNE
ncbi:MAG: ribosomal protein S18-alanine N-acetyltransferase [Halanaeroarchaeum sp.]